MLVSGFASTSDVVFLFAGAGIVLYVASRAAADALTPSNDPAPGRMALAQWMPIAWTALLSTLAGQPQIGIGVIFATSVAVLALVLGVLLCIVPQPTGTGPSSTAWPFVVPAALVVLLAGFSAALAWWHALMLLALGIAVLGVWCERTTGDGLPFAKPLDSPRTRAWQLVLSTVLGAVGAWLAYKATTVADQRTRIASGGLIALAVLSPLLVLPVIGTAAAASHHNRTGSAVAAIVGIVLLNLCLLLPLTVFAHYTRQFALAWLNEKRSIELLSEAIGPMPFPLAIWRVDTVLLLVLGLMLIPVSLGRWTLHKAEGLLLAMVYAAYLVVSTWLATRR